MDVNLAMIQAANETIKKYMPSSLCENSIFYSKQGLQVAMKLECHNYTRSFKIRGAINMLANLTDSQKDQGVITVSSGNHGAGVSFASKLLSLPSAPMIVVPATTPMPKVQRIAAYGGDLIKYGENYDAAHAHANELVAKTKKTFVDSCSDPKVIAGQGTIALELMASNPDVEGVLVPIGGGGMAAGVCIAFKKIKPNVKIIGVQTKACPAMVKSIADNYCYETFPNQPSVCDALIGGVGKLPFEILREQLDDIIVVEEPDILSGVRNLFLEERIVAEPAGAITYAAASEKYLPKKLKKIAVVVSGGNISADLFMQILNSNQSSDGGNV